MRDYASAIAFFCWTLPAPIIACVILFKLSSGAGSGVAYMLPFIVAGSVAGLVLGSLLTGWLTRTLVASLTGMGIGLMAAVVAVRGLLGI